MDKCREAFEVWFRTTPAYQMLEEMNYFKMDLFHFVDVRNEYRHSSVQIAYMTWQSRQAEVDFLSAQLGIKRDQIKGFEGETKKAWQAVEEKGKRIEAALKEIFHCRVIGTDRIYTCDAIEKALRGDDDINVTR